MKTACNTSCKVQFEAVPYHDYWAYIYHDDVELSQLVTDLLLHFE